MSKELDRSEAMVSNPSIFRQSHYIVLKDLESIYLMPPMHHRL